MTPTPAEHARAREVCERIHGASVKHNWTCACAVVSAALATARVEVQRETWRFLHALATGEAKKTARGLDKHYAAPRRSRKARPR